MKFVKLTDKVGLPVWVNIELVASIHPGGEKKDHSSVLVFKRHEDYNDQIRVEDKFETIVDILE